ncbi:metallophosphoesterase [Lunatibacter salilacus]|uniref:metallophosphoesterase n=1 Tax=Lunatibacter salilacus TaxID=2483804 RepID=UPI00131E5FEE|nr:metallophosphoesterase [Lunatibacter salilacus]
MKLRISLIVLITELMIVITGLAQEKPLFSFGVISDVQYADVDQAGERDYRGSLAILEKTVKELNRHELAFTVNLGDLIDRDLESFGKPLYVLTQSKAKIHHVFGNHDYTVADEHKKEVPKLLGNPNGYHAFTHGQFVFVVLNGMYNSLDGHPVGSRGYKKAEATLAELEVLGASNAKPWNGGLGRKQINWLEKTLANAQKEEKRVVVFCHYPLLPENGLHLWNNREVLAMLDKYTNVVAYFSGHHHAGNYVVENGLHHLTFYGMVEAKSPNLGAVVRVFEDRLVLEGIGDQESREMRFR